MKFRHSRASVAAGSLLALSLLAWPGRAPQAAMLQWTGGGASALWSDAANWNPLQVPGNGDELLFGGATTQPSSIFDLTRTFASLAFAANAQAYALHVQGSGATLAFDGLGIRNATAGSGPIRQDLYADAGSVGGTIAFSGGAGINVGDASSLRPVNLTARGGASATAIGGHIVFEGQATTSASTFDQLRAEGATAAGGSGGDITFRGNAVVTRSAIVTLTGGTVAGAFGGRASFGELSRAESTFTLLAGDGGGQGARADFAGLATASVYASFANRGGAAAAAGAQAITTFREDARLVGSVSNEAGTGVGSYGGQLEFKGRASHDTTGIDPSLGLVQIRNLGASVGGARGGSTVFSDDAFVLGDRLLIINVQAEGADAGAGGGTVEFRDRSRAGRASVLNEGAGTAGSGNGLLFFSGQASAESANIVNAPGSVTATLGGATRFAGRAVAAMATIANNASDGPGAGAGGSTVFADDSSAQQAVITNEGGVLTSDNATTAFRDRAGAGQALIANAGGRAASAFGGATTFDGLASAGSARLTMVGGSVSQALGGFAVFYADSHAGAATLDVRAATVLGATGGRVLFYDRSSAGAALVTIAGSAIDHVLGSEGGAVSFAGLSSAADAAFTASGNSFAGGGVGALRFTEGSTAARAVITLLAGETRGGLLSFEGASVTTQAGAGSARITNRGASSAVAARGLAIGGQTSFGAYSSADTASITNEAGTGEGLTTFFAGSTAGDASLLNLGGSALEDGGSTQFNNTSSAGRASIVNRAGARGSSGFDAAGLTRFVDQASAGQARITAEGASSASAIGGLISFSGASNPANATLIAEGGTGGGTGGRIQFAGLTNASQARVILNAGSGAGSGGGLDISGISVPGVAIGSLEGGGIVSLGSKNLVVWSSTARTTFSGLLRDGGVGGGVGGSLSVSGGAVLTLAGANTYTGVTRVGDGVNANSGKLVAANGSGSATGTGAVIVQRGGTLGGSGFIGGPVTLMSGGLIAPGDPVTLTLNGGLTWDGGGVIRLALGADAAGSDHLVVHELSRGAVGVFVFDLVDFGITAGATYDLLHFDSLVGFSASDFSFVGLAGSFTLRGDHLEFTTSPVPEPGAALLWLAGWLLLAAAMARRAA